ncbi:MAG TPA: alpha/beta fold hydrolase [Thermoanaerobaculia bacterium]|jgi:alpha-beta hydrolase superfamily lysophospholipase
MRELVILVHGLGRTPASMWALELEACRRGYEVVNWHYRSRRDAIAEHAARLGRELGPRMQRAAHVHFVTHSLGGIVVREFLSSHELPNLGRVVMLAPPNGGSEIADRVTRSPLASRLAGKPVRELTTARQSPAVRFAVGVIAGSRKHLPLRWIEGASDGVVAVERTKLDGMRDFLVLRRTHTFLPWSRDAIAQTFAFLERERFTR